MELKHETASSFNDIDMGAAPIETGHKAEL